MEEEIVTVATFGTVLEAQLARNRLEAEKIPAFVSDDATVGLWNLGGAFGVVKLQVAEAHVERAQEILDLHCAELSAEEGSGEHDLSAAIQPAWTCSRCGTRVNPAITTCPGCGTPEDDQETLSPSRPNGPLLQETDRIPESRNDRLASRAMRAAIWGLFVLPPLLHLYSVFLLLRLAFSSEELSRSAMRKVYIALVLDVLVCSLVGALLAGALGVET